MEQKRKSKDNVNSLLKRLSLNKGPNDIENEMLNQSIPDHFEYMKNQDSINEKRPSLLNKINPDFSKEVSEDREDLDTNKILNDPSLK